MSFKALLAGATILTAMFGATSVCAQGVPVSPRNRVSVQFQLFCQPYLVGLKTPEQLAALIQATAYPNRAAENGLTVAFDSEVGGIEFHDLGNGNRSCTITRASKEHAALVAEFNAWTKGTTLGGPFTLTKGGVGDQETVWESPTQTILMIDENDELMLIEGGLKKK